jgi:hypothetical protein
MRPIENNTNASTGVRFIMLFAVFLALTASAFAAVNVTDYLYPTESAASLQEFATTVGGTTYSVVTLAGKEEMVLKGGAFVKTEDEIKTVLTSRCFDLSYPTALDVDGIKNSVLAFDSSRETPHSIGTLEGYCDMITGQAKENEGGCTDIVTCQRACNQGSYACLQYGMGSAIFLPELLKYADTKRALDADVGKMISLTDKLKSASNSQQVSFSVTDQLSQLRDVIADLQNLSGNYSTNKLFIRSQYGGFEFCIPVGFTVSLNNSALTDASSKASTLITKAACFDDVGARSSYALNSTLQRISTYVGTKQKGSVQEQFDILTSKFNNLTLKASAITELVDDQNITIFTEAVNTLSAQYYSNVDQNLYDQAGLAVSSIDSRLTDFEEYLNNSYMTLGSLVGARANASLVFAKASLLISSEDSTLSADLKKQGDKLAVLEQRIKSRISYDEIDAAAANYDTITSDLSSLIEKKKALELSRADDVISGAARGLSLSVLNVVSAPLGIKESDKRAWISNVPMIAIGFVDIAILAVLSIGFFFIVWRHTEKFMQARVMKTWGIIFVFVLILLIGISVGLNSIIGAQTGQTSLLSYMAQANKDNNTVLFLERSSSSNGTSIEGCASQIEQALTALGKNVTKIEVIDGVCNDRIISECLTDVGQTPIVRLKYASKNASSFYKFYKTEAILEGDEAYFNECLVAKFMVE